MNKMELEILRMEAEIKNKEKEFYEVRAFFSKVREQLENEMQDRVKECAIPVALYLQDNTYGIVYKKGGKTHFEGWVFDKPITQVVLKALKRAGWRKASLLKKLQGVCYVPNGKRNKSHEFYLWL